MSPCPPPAPSFLEYTFELGVKEHGNLRHGVVLVELMVLPGRLLPQDVPVVEE